jgi:hypothetical protein
VSALAVIREMVAVQREMAAIQGQALKALADNHAQILASAAEVMRAPRPAPVLAELRNAADDEDKNGDDDEYDDELEDDDTEEEETSNGVTGLLAHLAKMIDPKDARKLGIWLMEKFIQFRRETATAAQPVNVTAAPTNVTVAPVNVAGAPAVAQVVPSQAAPVGPAAPVIASEVVASGVTTALEPVATSTAEPTTSEATEDAGPHATGQIPPLTQEQLVHLAMINAQLSPEEQTIAEQVMRRMSAATMQRWLVELSAMSVDDATATVRQAINERINERNQRRTKATR